MRLATYLADEAAASQDAPPDQLTQLARALFVDVVIQDRRAVAVLPLPRPELRPLFVDVAPPELARKSTKPGV